MNTLEQFIYSGNASPLTRKTFINYNYMYYYKISLTKSYNV